MGSKTAIFMLAALAAAAGPASAQESTRYRLEKTDDGYVRMDTDTGAMSICKERGEQLVCRLAADERSAFDDEVGNLQKRVDRLEKRVSELEKIAGPRITTGLPSDEEVDKTLGIMERFFRRFMDMVQDFDKKTQEPNDAPAEPGKT